MTHKEEIVRICYIAARRKMHISRYAMIMTYILICIASIRMFSPLNPIIGVDKPLVHCRCKCPSYDSMAIARLGEKL